MKPKKELLVHQTITLLFPPGTTLTPSLPEDENERREMLNQIDNAVYVNGLSVGGCIGLPRVEFNQDGSIWAPSAMLRPLMDKGISEISSVMMIPSKPSSCCSLSVTMTFEKVARFSLSR